MALSRSAGACLPLLLAAAFTISAGFVATETSGDHRVRQDTSGSGRGAPPTAAVPVVAVSRPAAVGDDRGREGRLAFTLSGIIPVVSLTVGLAVVAMGVLLSVQVRRRPLTSASARAPAPADQVDPYPSPISTRGSHQRYTR